MSGATVANDALSILAAAKEEPDRPAIIGEGGVLTFRDVAVRVRRAMGWLRQRAPSKVAVVATLRAETLIAFYALFELGVPVIALHPRATPAEREAAVATVGGALLLDETWTDASPDGATPDAAAGGAVVARADARIATEEPVAGDAPLAILFTSGTSGAAKGVVLSRGALLAAAAASAANLGWQSDDRWLLCMPLGHVGGLSVVVRCLIARRPIVLVPWTGAVAPLLAAIERHRVTLLSLVPTMLRRIFDEEPSYRFPDAVRAVLLGGDASSPALLEECARRRAPVLTTYGLTEACAQVATQQPGEPPTPAAGVGRPLSHVEVRIQDGEVQLRGPMLMSGYFPVGEGPSPFLDGGWFPTGDLGVIDEGGRLHIRGRRSDRLITGGENVDPLEVERALVACAGVASACVFGVPDERWGQTIAAAIVPTEAASPPSPAEIASSLGDRLASFKRPRAYAICTAFVLNAASKVDRARTAAAVRDRLIAVRSTPRGS